jgi:fructose-1,6-bisphosphatase/inositol monophosphatase family enzyme
MSDPRRLLAPVLRWHDELRDAVVAATEQRSLEAIAAVDRDEDGDTIYAIDAVSEQVLEPLADALGREQSFVLVAEGLPGGRRCVPASADERSATWRIIVDPIDGTRGLMYQKRSAWILTGIAPNRGAATSLRDIVLAVQTEIPLVKQHLADQMWALRGSGVEAVRMNRLTGTRTPLILRPSSAATIAHGFATVARFFPGARETLGALDDAIVRDALGVQPAGKALCFEDQYASTGGQLYELMAGHDRFIADLRPLTTAQLAEAGLPPPLACHPYDICCAMIAEECGVIVTDPSGRPLDAPLDVESAVAWVGYANVGIRAALEPPLQQQLRARGWLEARAQP